MYNLRNTILLSFCLLNLSIFSIASAGIIRTVKKSGGSFTTIQACLNTAQPGDTCLVSSGLYSETVAFPKAGTAENIIQLKAEYPFTKASPLNRAIIVGKVTLKGFNSIFGFEISSGYIVIDGSNTEVSGNYVHSNGNGAIYGLVQFTTAKPFHSNVIVKNNYLYQAKNHMLIRCADNCLIENNEMEKLFDSPSCRPTEACSGDTDYVRMWGNGITFRRNKFHGSVMTDIDEDAHVDCIQSFTSGGYGGQGRDTLTNILVDANFFSDCEQHFFITTSADGLYSKNITLQNNIFYESWVGSPIITVGGYQPLLDDVFIYNNIFHDSVKVVPATRAIVKNNIFLQGLRNVMGTSGTQFVWPQGEHYEISNNFFATNKYADLIKKVPSLAESNKFDVKVSDLFVNVNVGDFRTKSGSPAIDAGVDLSHTFSHDFLGTLRPIGSTWDVGAYEYLPQGTTGKPVTTGKPATTASTTGKPSSTTAATTGSSATTGMPVLGLSFEAYKGIITGAMQLTDENHVIVTANNNGGNPTNGGKASYNFAVPAAGNYSLIFLIRAPTTASDSLYVNINAEPIDPDHIWDVENPGRDLDYRSLTWRGKGSFDKPEFKPKVFFLNAGIHNLIIRGRESKVEFAHISVVPYQGGNNNPNTSDTSNPETSIGSEKSESSKDITESVSSGYKANIYSFFIAALAMNLLW